LRQRFSVAKVVIFENTETFFFGESDITTIHIFVDHTASMGAFYNRVRIPAQWTQEKKQKCIGRFDTREEALDAIEKHRPADFPFVCTYIMHNTRKK